MLQCLLNCAHANLRLDVLVLILIDRQRDSYKIDRDEVIKIDREIVIKIDREI